MALRGRDSILGVLMYRRMYHMSVGRKWGTEVKTPRAMTSRSIRANHTAQLQALSMVGCLWPNRTVNDVFNSEQLENHR